MSRVQLALNVEDLESAIDFYSALLGVEPAKRKPGYANFAVADPALKLVLMENKGQGGTINHLGIEVEDVAAVTAAHDRVATAGLVSTEQAETTCCYAAQDKFWVDGDPDGLGWEVYTVLQDSETFSGTDAQGGACCGGAQSEAEVCCA